jgi:hypothetical protein
LPEKLSPETQSPPDLTAFHCAEIGIYALHADFYAISVEFIELAIQKFVQQHDRSIPLASLEMYLELAVRAVSLYSILNPLSVRYVELFPKTYSSKESKLQSLLQN